MSGIDTDLRNFLTEHGLAERDEEPVWTPLTGGVSSDIWRVETGRGTVCVKRALPRLKVAAAWEAPVDRNAYEWAFIEVASAIAPGSVPRPIAHDPQRGVFAMSWLPPQDYLLWKSELLGGRVDPDFAAAVGDLVGRLHAATALSADIERRFDTDRHFGALRLDPYLASTAERHPALSAQLNAIIDVTRSTHLALVHGDVSPKNILMGPEGPVLLDAEVAWFGDPAFDLAFCLNHVMIKSRIVAGAAAALLKSFNALTNAYLSHVHWEDAAGLEARAARLLPALALARVDGKSPVEYLDADARLALRAAASAAVAAAPCRLAQARDLLSKS